jgi:hypothetical protein
VASIAKHVAGEVRGALAAEVETTRSSRALFQQMEFYSIVNPT